MTSPGMEWTPEEEFRRLNIGEDVRYRSVLRLDDNSVWCAPLGTPDPWPDDPTVRWVAL